MFILNATERDIFGKKLIDERNKGKLPVVAYGPEDKNSSLFVDLRDFKKVWKQAGESSIISLVSGKDRKEVLIHDVALDPITDQPIHVDFYVVPKGKAIRVTVPLTFSGVAPSVKALGGVLVKVMHEVEVEALAGDLPHELNVDISTLATFDDRVVVGGIVLPRGVKIVFPTAEEVVALVAQPREDKEEEAVPVDLTQIEVEKKGKKPGEEGETVPEATIKGGKEQKK